MSFKSVQSKLQNQGHSKESAGKILGAAAQKAKHPSPAQRKVLGAQGKKRKPYKKHRPGEKKPMFGHGKPAFGDKDKSESKKPSWAAGKLAAKGR